MKQTISQYDVKTCYVRIRVTNTGRRIAKDCRAYLVGFKKLNGAGRTLATGYVDSIPLCWSYRSEDDPHGIDIPSGPNIHCDVFSTDENTKGMMPSLVKAPRYCEALFKDPATYVFDIMVTADEIPPKRIAVKVVWKGVWNDFEASRYEE
jgi:hypothetical protein